MLSIDCLFAYLRRCRICCSTLLSCPIDQQELALKRYGPSTAKAVLFYKKKRNIINRSYQTRADDIVGIMTMASLDKEMLAFEQSPDFVRTIGCRTARANPEGSQI
jgi:hypothetical protein